MDRWFVWRRFGVHFTIEMRPFFFRMKLYRKLG
jgi:hypothetical protein